MAIPYERPPIDADRHPEFPLLVVASLVMLVALAKSFGPDHTKALSVFWATMVLTYQALAWSSIVGNMSRSVKRPPRLRVITGLLLALGVLAYVSAMVVWIQSEFVQVMIAGAAGGLLALIFTWALRQIVITQATLDSFKSEAIGVAIAALLSVVAYGFLVWGVAWLSNHFLSELLEATSLLPAAPNGLALPQQIPGAAWGAGTILAVLVVIDAWGLGAFAIRPAKLPRGTVSVTDLGKRVAEDGFYPAEGPMRVGRRRR
jgi:hypothetical protein